MKYGSLTLWMRKKRSLSGMIRCVPTGKAAPRTDRDTAIVCMAWLLAVCWLALPATQGLLSSVLKLQGGVAGAGLYDFVSAAPEA